MGRCKNCKFFKRNVGDYNTKYGACDNKKIIYDDMGSDEYEETDYLIYTDYEGYNAFSEVGEDFGCVHFREKENKK